MYGDKILDSVCISTLLFSNEQIIYTSMGLSSNLFLTRQNEGVARTVVKNTPWEWNKSEQWLLFIIWSQL